MATTTKDSTTVAQSLLTALSGAFDAAIVKVATLCARNGRLDATLLDRHQWVSYELALADADLLAAKTVLAAGRSASSLDADLALAFAAEAIVSALGRLESVYVATGLDGQ